MECKLNNTSIQLINNAFTCMSKISSEILFKCCPDKLQLQALDTGKCSVLTVTFEKSVLTLYNCSEIFCFSVNSKAIIASLREIKHVEEIDMKTEISGITYQFSIELLCKHKVRKLFRIPYHDCDLLNPVFDMNKAPNRVSIRPSLLLKAIQYIQSTEEILMTINPNAISIESIQVSNSTHTKTDLEGADINEIHIISQVVLKLLTPCLLAVLQLMNNYEVSLINLLFKEGGENIAVCAKPGCEKEGISIDYISTSASEILAHTQPVESATPEVTKRSHDAITPTPQTLSTSPVQLTHPEDHVDKQVDILNPESSDEDEWM